MQFLSPAVEVRTPPAVLSETWPLPSLDGIRLGTVEIPFHNADRFVRAVQGALVADHGAVPVVQHRKLRISEALPEPTIAQLVDECDVVVSAFAH